MFVISDNFFRSNPPWDDPSTFLAHVALTMWLPASQRDPLHGQHQPVGISGAHADTRLDLRLSRELGLLFPLPCSEAYQTFLHPTPNPSNLNNHTAGACFGAFILWAWHWLGGPVTQREAANRARVLK